MTMAVIVTQIAHISLDVVDLIDLLWTKLNVGVRERCINILDRKRYAINLSFYYLLEEQEIMDV